MALLDVKINIDRIRPTYQYSEHEVNSGYRVDRPPSNNNNNQTSLFVNIEEYWESLYESASNAAKFKNVFDQVSHTGLNRTEILTRVGPLLHVAASHGNAEIVKLIITKFPCLLISKKDFSGDTVWHIAAKTGKVIDQLFELRNAFELSLTFSPVSAVKWEDIYLGGINENGNTALHEALINRHESIAQQLFEVKQKLSFHVNKEKKSAVYLAAEAGYADILSSMLKYGLRNMDLRNEMLQGKSIVHAAIMGKHQDVLALILEKYGWLNETQDEEGMNPLHWAASIGFSEGIRYLLNQKKSMESDKKGLKPIHWAAMNGHVEVVDELLQHNRDSNNLVSSDGRNILHVAAKSGRHNVVSYILKTQELGGLINQSDDQENTPLHLATIHWHLKIVSSLTRDKRVNLSSINKEGLTALDAAVFNMMGISSFRQWLTWQVLKAAGAQRAPSSKVLNAERKATMSSKSPNNTNYKIMVKALLLVSIIVAMVSFEAGSTKLADYNNFDTDLGITTTLRHVKIHLFIFCNSVAMYSSIIVVGILIWAHFGDDSMTFTALRVAKPLLGMALTMATLALVAGVYIVGSKVYWLADVVLTTVMSFLVFFAMLFLPVCLPLPSGYRIFRYITYFPIRLMIFYICGHLEE